MAYGVNIIQQPPCGLLNLRGRQHTCKRYNAALGLELPQTANTTTANDDITAMWLGPDEWLIKTDDGNEMILADSLRQASKGQHAAVTLVSDAYMMFTVSGKDARAVLNQGTGSICTRVHSAPVCVCAPAWARRE